MGRENERPPAKSDQPTRDQPAKARVSGAVKEWNEKAVRSRESVAAKERAALSPKEAAERRSRAQPAHGMGFDYAKSQLPKGEFERWHKGLSPQERALLKQPGTRVEIYGSASRPGSKELNQRLSRERAEAVSKELQNRLGISKDSIKTVALGEDPAVDNLPPGTDPRKFENQDDRTYRVVDIVIVPGEKAEAKQPPKNKEAGESGKKVAEGAKIDKPSPKYTPKEGMRDLPKFVKDYKKVVLESAKRLFKAIHETHKLNEQASHRCGIKYGAAILSTDGMATSRNPHVEQGKPYTGDELWNKLDKSPLKNSFHREMTWNLVENRDGYKVVKKALQEIADAVNKLLAGAKTPAERRAVLRDFSAGVAEQLQKNRPRPRK